MSVIFKGGVNMNNRNNEQDFYRNDRNRDLISNALMPEARGTTGFAMKGMLMLLGLLGIIALFKYFF